MYASNCVGNSVVKTKTIGLATVDAVSKHLCYSECIRKCFNNSC